ncbi:phosphatidate cytidylyltransferase [Spirochaetia bacterium]|nr:phosphatidate cytidylyltransferase [Spirochaetia bacterium]GHU33828.1 phosphatidate cytidylyltransferase [Spirochaetia bacterium]
MNKLIGRLVIFFVGLPLVVGIVLFLPYQHHLALNLLCVLASALGAAECANLYKIKGSPVKPVQAALLGILGPAAQTLATSFNLNPHIVPAAIIAGVLWLLISLIFVPESRFPHAVDKFRSGCALVLYPGVLLLWIIRLDSVPILVFLLIVIANDSLAWVFGTLFGKGNRGIIPVSPNKSAAGFCGGLIASIIVGIGAVFIVPDAFNSRTMPPVLSGFLLGIITGIIAIFGDLAESALKRSVNVKDSGVLIPGRGGILDSIDSISMAAPVYYLLYSFMFR